MNEKVAAIKDARLREFALEGPSGSLLVRAARRFVQLSQAHSPRRALAYFAGRIAARMRPPLALRLATTWPGAVLRRLPSVSRTPVSPGTCAYAIRMTGGVGDAVVIARLARDLQAALGGGWRFDVYFHNPDAIRMLFAGIEGFGQCMHDKVFDAVVGHYLFALSANHFVTFVNEHLQLRALVADAPRVVRAWAHVEVWRQPVDKFIRVHPDLDGAFADAATRAGHKRHTYLHAMLGVPYGGDRLALAVDRTLPARLGLAPGRYITVHDGWDTKFRMIAARPTKAIPLATWSAIVSGLKAQHPGVQVVQLGGATGQPIPGVDRCLKQALSLDASISVLAGSRLHLDAESGLVHIAAALGVRSVVMFGPTNVAWFGYARNINIAPRRCGNCWWSTDTWMDACPAGHAIPVCTAPDSIRVRDVLARVAEALRSPLPVESHDPAPAE